LGIIKYIQCQGKEIEILAKQAIETMITKSVNENYCKMIILLNGIQNVYLDED